MSLTPEQHDAVCTFANVPQNLRLIAYAGAGKTHTLQAMAASRPTRSGLYVAFNRAIADEAAHKFAGTRVQARTAHSLAFRYVQSLGYSQDKMTRSLSTRILRDTTLDAWGKPLRPLASLGSADPVTVGQLVLGTLRRFYQSWDREVSKHHVPRSAKPLPPEEAEYLRQQVAHVASWVWHYQRQVNHELPMGHDGYVKLWALSKPRLDSQYDFILLDEAQDLNPVLIGVMTNQGCQTVAVGDTYQQIYEWRGAVDALRILQGEQRYLTGSFRFGQGIANFANRLLEAMGERRPMVGYGDQSGYVVEGWVPSNAILFRTNAGVIEQLAQSLAEGIRVYVAGGTAELLRLVNDCERLRQGKAAETAELLGFSRWDEVQEYADTDEGRHLRTFVRLVDVHGVNGLRDLLAAAEETPETASLTLSTAHKAKGLEWHVVQLAHDFKTSGPDKDPINMAERKLFYVAATRARQVLGVDPQMAAAYMTAALPEEIHR